MIMKRIFIFILFSLLVTASLFAEDDFSPFGSVGVDGAGGSSAGFSEKSVLQNIALNGEFNAGWTGFYKEIKENSGDIKLGTLASAKLTFTAEGEAVRSFIGIKFIPRFGDETDKPIFIVDELYGTVFFNYFSFSAGLKKITWGRADSESILDIINPKDYSDLSELANGALPKIARPLLLTEINLNNFSKLEGVFIPTFQDNKYAEDGIWKPLRIINVEKNLAQLLIIPPTIDTLSNFQAALRYSAFFSGFDIGIQYYYGYIARPAFSIYIPDNFPIAQGKASMLYNRVHHAGVDFASSVFGCNIRAEAALNLTNDTDGSDPSIYNSNFAWDFGFDKMLFGFNFNFQVSEKIRLNNNNIDTRLYDIEHDTKNIMTRLTSEISHDFLRGTLILKAAFIYDIEEKSALIMPSITALKGDVEFKVAGGFFLGSSTGELGSYKDASFIKTMISWMF